MNLTIEETKYWAEKYLTCFPATYPPELWKDKEFEYVTGIWPFKRTHTYIRGVCKLCGEELLTGHRCDFIIEYMENRKK